jgi:hypothetical protein
VFLLGLSIAQLLFSRNPAEGKTVFKSASVDRFASWAGNISFVGGRPSERYELENHA